jgi:tetratricopeptide (TPR) repeat protein/predicted Ser/Thr protein kinase
MSSVDADLGALLLEVAPRPDADAVRALAAARRRVLGVPATTRLGRYVLGDLLGSGGMGKVFRARDEALDRDVAIKLIRSGLDVETLQREAFALAHLSHPNVVRVFDLGRSAADDGVFVVMELVRGMPLQRWLAAETRPCAAILAMFEQIARGLAATHDAGIVHGDVKPSNVIVDERGEAKLLDFGLSRIVEGAASTGDGGRSDITVVGGTPGYMAPEQLEGAACDALGDQYAFCVALKAALGGTRRVPRAVARMLERGLQRVPQQRWASMHDVLAQLGEPRRLGAAIPIAGVMAAVGALWIAAPSEPTPAQEPCPPMPVDWGGARRTATRAGIAAVDRPWSDAMATFVAQRLDRRAEALARAWADTCAPHVPAIDVPSVRGCIERAAAEFGEVAGALALGDAAVAEHAPTLLLLFAGASACETARGLADAAHRSGVVHSVAAALSAIRAGDSERARGLAGAIRLEAQRDRDPQRVALASWLDAAAARDAQDPGAEAMLRQAVEVAAAAGATAVEFTAALDLAALRVARGDNLDAQHWVRQAAALGERLRESDVARARVLVVQAAIDRVTARVEEAQSAAVEARTITEANLGVAHPDVASVHVTLGSIAMLRGDRATARAELCGAHAALAAALGDSHVATLEVAQRCAATFLHHDPAEARRRLTALLSRLDATGVPGDIVAANALMHLGIAEKHLRNPAAAVERHLQSDAIYVRSIGEDHPGRVAVLSNLGSALLQTGEPERAQVAYLRATTLAGVVFGESHPHTAQAWVGLAEARLVLDDTDAAIEAAERAFAFQTKAGVAPASLAESQAVLAEALVAARRDLPRARRLARSAHATLRARSVETKEYRRVVGLLAALDRIAPEPTADR